MNTYTEYSSLFKNRNRSQKVVAYRQIVRQFLPSAPQDEGQNDCDVVTLDGWEYNTKRSLQQDSEASQMYVDGVYTHMLEELRHSQEMDEFKRESSAAARKDFRRNAKLILESDTFREAPRVPRQQKNKDRGSKKSPVHCYYR